MMKKMTQASDLETARRFVKAAGEKEHALYVQLCTLQGRCPHGARGYTILQSFDSCTSALKSHLDAIKAHEIAIAGFNEEALKTFNKLLATSGLEIA